MLPYVAVWVYAVQMRMVFEQEIVIVFELFWSANSIQFDNFGPKNWYRCFLSSSTS